MIMKKGEYPMSDLHCTICGNSGSKSICKNCAYLLKNGATEESIRKTLGDHAAQKVWKANRKIAEGLAKAYYGHLLENYNPAQIKKDFENFGFNAFADGINLGLDVIMPLLDEEHSKKVLEKIENMVSIRKKNER